jgi:hypothetical protein
MRYARRVGDDDKARMATGWRVVFEDGFPIKTLAFLGLIIVVTGVWVWALLFAVPAERDVIANGRHVTAHVITSKFEYRNKATKYYAALTWQDAGQPRSYPDLAIGANAFAAIGSANTTEIIYVDGERPIVVADLDHRAAEQSDVWVGLVVFAIITLLAGYHLRRRVQEWRTEQSARTAPPPW